jgi:hypothetical protein
VAPVPPRWREYQDEAAEFFRSLGMRATVDAAVEGARSTHNVDVLVEFEAFGLEHRWIVECKAWNRRVPKERVETLKMIVAETGVDRGFLICERGAQSGAITASRNSNVTLTSIADLRANAEADLADLRWNDLLQRWFDWNRRAYEGPIRTSDWEVRVSHVNAMGELEVGLQKFRLGQFPAPYGAVSDWEHDKIRPLFADSSAEFLDRASETLRAAEAWLKKSSDCSA